MRDEKCASIREPSVTKLSMRTGRTFHGEREFLFDSVCRDIDYPHHSGIAILDVQNPLFSYRYCRVDLMAGWCIVIPDYCLFRCNFCHAELMREQHVSV